MVPAAGVTARLGGEARALGVRVALDDFGTGPLAPDRPAHLPGRAVIPLPGSAFRRLTNAGAARPVGVLGHEDQLARDVDRS
ncbi:hypothetical protein [Actinoplanes sp. NPDC051411]|uniref:hypothetical protein n=1 Tax=Actinoplanes sp. NPDC051411 TaxID=3155522 RepID=UPI00342FC5D9